MVVAAGANTVRTSVAAGILACLALIMASGCYHPADAPEKAPEVAEALPTVKPPAADPEPVTPVPAPAPVSSEPVPVTAPPAMAPAEAVPPPQDTETAIPEAPSGEATETGEQSSPLPEEPTTSPASDEVTEAPKPGLSLETMAKLNEGMSYDEVIQLVGVPGVTVSTNGVDTVIYRWSDDGGSFLGKFQDGKLVRKNVQSRQESSEAEEASAEGERLITEEQYNEVKEGMTVEEVLALLNVEAKTITDDGQDAVAIYQWRDERGSSFTARFENGKLARKTGFYVAPLEKPEEKAAVSETGEIEGAAEGESVAVQEATNDTEQPAEEEYAPENSGREENRREVIADEAASDVSEESYPDRESASEPVEESAQQEQVTRTNPRVRVAGSSRREREQAAAEAAGEESPVAGRSYKPKAKLPDYTYSFRKGSYEVRLRNYSESAVKAGLRAGKRGKDVRIAPGGEASIFVDRGSYELYYVFNDAPYTLHHGGGIPIDDAFQTDIEVSIMDDASESE